MSATTIPRAAGFDQTLAFLREGYDFISRRCDRFGTDIFEARIMLRPVTCIRGAEAAETFYDGERFTRRKGAMPPTVLRLLQDKGSVQQLDGAEHRHRKALFTGLLMTDQAERGFLDIFAEEWTRALELWRNEERIALLDASYEVLTRAACRWTGVPDADQQLENDLSNMIERAGSIGPSMLVALARRRRAERRMRDLIIEVRSGALALDERAPLAVIAMFPDEDGTLLDPEAAAVEVLNILRPAVAIGRYIMFAAMALHEHPAWREKLAGSPHGAYRHFAEEVRRRYPFFPVIGGIVQQPFEWLGRRFKRDEWVLLDLFGTSHDPRLFPEPDDFRPSRHLDWRNYGYGFIPQGAGDPPETHRCPGERLTVAVMIEATRFLVERMSYIVPEQDLAMPSGRMPARPKAGFLMQEVAPLD